MELKKLLKCSYCKYFLHNPIILLCCDGNVCHHHINEIQKSLCNSDKLICKLCNKTLDTQMFVVNEMLNKLIEKIGFNNNPMIEIKSLTVEIPKFKHAITNAEELIHNRCNDVKSKVEFDRQQLKLRIDSLADEEIKKIESYENEMNENLKKNIDLNHYNRLLNDFEQHLAQLKSSLNSKQLDEEDPRAFTIFSSIFEVQRARLNFEKKLFSILSNKNKYEPRFTLKYSI